MSDLQIESLNKYYGGLHVLQDIDLHMESGEFLVLVGPSGCGKSTLLNSIAGISDISDGKICIDGQDVTHKRPKDRDIAMVFQSYALYPNMSVRRNMGFALEMQKVPVKERNKIVENIATQLQLTQYLDRKPGELSGGQRQRVAMGRALVRNPKIFLFDEPLSNLDANLRVEMRTELKTMHQRLQATIIYVTHDQIEAMTLATRIVVMKEGIIQQIGTPEAIYDQPANLFVAAFVGSPPLNLLPAQFDPARQSVTVMAQDPLTKSDVPLVLPNALSSQCNANGEVVLGLRPESIRICNSKDQSLCPGEQKIRADIKLLELTGPDVVAVIKWRGHELIARLAREDTLMALAQADFIIDMKKALLFDAQSGKNLNFA